MPIGICCIPKSLRCAEFPSIARISNVTPFVKLRLSFQLFCAVSRSAYQRCTVRPGTTAHTCQATPRLAVGCTEVQVSLSLVSVLSMFLPVLQLLQFAAAIHIWQASNMPNIHIYIDCIAMFVGYQGKFSQASFNNDDHHTVDEVQASHGMPATHSDAESCAYQGHFGTTPGAKLFEPQHSGELERKGSTYHGRFGNQ